MNAPLRPMNLGEILDRTLQIYRERFWLFVLIACMPVIAWELISFVVNNSLHAHSLNHPLQHLGILLWNFVVLRANYYAFFVVVFLAESAAVKATAGYILRTECSIVSSLRFAVARWRPYLWIALLVASACLVVAETESVFRRLVSWFFVDVAGSLGQKLGWAVPTSASIATVSGWALVLWLFVRLSLAVPACGLEDLPAFRSLRQSWILTRKSWGRIWLTLVGLTIGLWASTWVLEFLLGQIMHFLGDVFHIPDAMRNLYGPATFVVASGVYVVLGPIFPIAITLFYYDQRIRLEGYDVERMMDSAGLISPILTAPTQTAPPAAQVAPAVESELVTPAAAEETHS